MPPITSTFDRTKHVYSNREFAELLKNAVRFFTGTPVLSLPPPEPFAGAGVYALYYIGRKGLYRKFGDVINREEYKLPIYVGKAVPSGWRQSRLPKDETMGKMLYNRLCQHVHSIESTKNLATTDFACRFAIFEGSSSDMIASVESALIAKYNPLWNSIIDGFGNHDPGKRRHGGKVPAWDILHPGREWAEKMTGERPNKDLLKQRVVDYLIGVRE